MPRVRVGSVVVALASLAMASAGCETRERVVVRRPAVVVYRPAPVVRVYAPRPVIEERVIVR
jgi:lipid A disaccharide synthetase